MELVNRNQLEAEFMQRMLKLSREQQRELQSYLGSPPDPDRVPSAFWQKVEKQRKDELAGLLILLFILSGDQLRKSGSSQLQIADQRIDNAAQQWGQAKSIELASSYTATSRDKLNRTAQEWRARSKAPTPAEGKRLAAEIFSPSRDENIAITATTQARSSGAETIAKALQITSENDYWQTEKDAKVCQICDSLQGKKRDVWSGYFPDGPPAHPRCRCEVVYVFESAGRRVAELVRGRN